MIFVVIRFSSRKQALAFVTAALAALVALVVYLGVASARDRHRAEVYRRLQSISQKLGGRMMAVKLECKKTVATLAPRAFPQGLSQAAPLAPTDTTQLRGAPFVVLSQETRVPPAGPFVSGELDCEPLPPAVREKAFASAGVYDEAQDEAQGQYQETLYKVVDQYTTPPVVGAVWCGYVKKAKAWEATYAWLSAKEARPLAVVRVRRPDSGPLGWCGGLSTAALASETAGWR